MSEEKDAGTPGPGTTHGPAHDETGSVATALEDRDAPGHGDPGAQEPSGGPARRGLGLVPVTVVAVVLLLVLVAATVVAVVMFGRVHDQDRDDRQRAAALSAAEQFSLRIDDVDGAHVDTYVSRIQQTLTAKAKTDFAKQFDSFKKVYQQAKATGSGKILMAGMQDSDVDSATVLVVHDATVKSTYGTQTRHQRWSVVMRKVDGRWLVDSFSPVT